MKKIFAMLNIITFIFMLIFDIFFMIDGKLLNKSIASIMFVVTVIINFIYCIKNKTDLKFPIWMLVGLIWGMIADIVLMFNFYLGALIFSIGHIFYFVSYCMIKKINFTDLLWCMTISFMSIFIILFTPFLDFRTIVIQRICCFYAFIISLMSGKAISNSIREKSITNRIIAFGSILFFISDFMLMLRIFADILVADYFCLSMYYPAQFLLAFSLFLYSDVNIMEEKDGV